MFQFNHCPRWVACVLAPAITLPAVAQVTYTTDDADQTYHSIATFTDFGESMLITDDFDGDGWRDILIGAVGFDAPAPLRGGTLPNTGGVLLISSQTGSLIRLFPGFQPESTIGFDLVELPDRNGDGVVDFAVGGPRLDGPDRDAGGYVVFSGADASIIGGAMGPLGPDALLGWSLAAIGDLTGDGIAELAAGAPGANAVAIFNGATDAHITTVFETQANASLGWSVRGAGDVNNDGTPDFIAGAPFYDTDNVDPDPNAGGADATRLDAGRAVVYSGSDFSPLHVLERHDTTVPHEVLSPFQNFGTRVDTVGDLNNDGHSDVIVGAPETSQGSGGAGHIVVYSGADGSVLYDIDGPQIPSEKHGERVVGIGDIDGDGTPDFAASSNQSCFIFPGCGRPGSVIVYSGATASPIAQYDGALSNDVFGAAIAVGDVNNDGTPDIVITALFHSTPSNSPGEAYLFLGTPVDQPADIDDNGVVDVFDLLELLKNWGTNGPGADIASPTDVVDVFDLLDLLDAWTV